MRRIGKAIVTVVVMICMLTGLGMDVYGRKGSDNLMVQGFQPLLQASKADGGRTHIGSVPVSPEIQGHLNDSDFHRLPLHHYSRFVSNQSPINGFYGKIVT